MPLASKQGWEGIELDTERPHAAPMVKVGYEGYINWEFCHPAKKDGAFAGIDCVHDQTEMAFESLNGLRDQAAS